jgi:hypothetical protein
MTDSRRQTFTPAGQPRHRGKPEGCGTFWASVFLIVASVVSAGTALVILDRVSQWVIR